MKYTCSMLKKKESIARKNEGIVAHGTDDASVRKYLDSRVRGLIGADYSKGLPTGFYEHKTGSRNGIDRYSVHVDMSSRDNLNFDMFVDGGTGKIVAISGEYVQYGSGTYFEFAFGDGSAVKGYNESCTLQKRKEAKKVYTADDFKAAAEEERFKNRTCSMRKKKESLARKNEGLNKDDKETLSVLALRDGVLDKVWKVLDEAADKAATELANASDVEWEDAYVAAAKMLLGAVQKDGARRLR